MRRKFGSERSHAIAGVFVFLLLGVFAVLSTMLVLFGTQAYRATTQHTQMHGDSRTLYAYVLNTVRGDDAQDVLQVEQRDGMDLLTMRYDYDGEIFIKRVYCYDGYLRELLTGESNEFDPAGGESICPAQEMRASLAGRLITIELIDAQGETQIIRTVLRTMR